MASIGAFSFTAMRGTVHPLGEELQRLRRMGLDGQAYRKAGREGGVGVLMTVTDFLSSTQNADVLLAAYRAIVGTRVTVVDGRGVTITGVVVLGVEALENQRIKSAVGGLVGSTADSLLLCRWDVEATNV